MYLIEKTLMSYMISGVNESYKLNGGLIWI